MGTLEYKSKRRNREIGKDKIKYMKNNLWIFGDSQTYGHGLKFGFEYYDENPDLRKPHHTKLLAEYFNCNLINFSVCGCSNHDIIFRLINQMHKMKENDVVYIKTTYAGRTNVFTDDGEFKSIHLGFGEASQLKGRIEDKTIDALSKYTELYLDENQARFEVRDFIMIESLKLELEKRNIKVIFCTSEVLHDSIKKHFGWKTIEEETNGKFEGYGNLGFTAQKPFADFIIKEYESGNTFINPNPEFYGDIKSVRFDFSKPINQVKNLFEFVSRRDASRDYLEKTEYK